MQPTTSSTSQDSLVSVRGLHFARGERVIFAGIDLDIQRGKITAIMGPSGEFINAAYNFLHLAG